MSDHPLSDAEVADFRALGLTSGNWAALAPVPLLVARGLRPPNEADFQLFRRLATHIPGGSGRVGEAEEFWTRHALTRPREAALVLLGWHLAKRLPRADREAYLADLHAAVPAFFPGFFAGSGPDVVRPVREVIEAALGNRDYRTHLSVPHVPPPDPDAVRRLADAAREDGVFAGGLDGFLALVAHRLAGYPFGDRYEFLEEHWSRVAPEWADRLRELVEARLGLGGTTMTGPQPEPVPAPEPAGGETATPEPVLESPPAETVGARPDADLTAAPAHEPGTAVTADAFTPLTLDEAFARARRTTVAEVREWLATPGKGDSLLFDDHRAECPDVAVVREPAAVPTPLWVIGDLHADVLALANLVAHAERETAAPEGPAFLFLGDFVDRGRYDHETLLLVFGLAMRYPGRVCVLPGNHDTDLRWHEKAGRFVVSIEPAEYCDRLNQLLGSEDPADRGQVELARLAIDFWKARPKAVFLPDGTVFAHGGFPHTDLQAQLRGVRQLGEPAAVSDFLWARLSESPKKRPNRGGGRGHEFGWKDFAQFCRVMSDTVGVPTRRLVRGHDHVAARWSVPPEYAEHGCPVLTLNAMGWRLEGEPEPPNVRHPFPVVARHTPGQLPAVVRVPLDPNEVERQAGAAPPRETSDFDPPEFFGSVAVERHEPPPRTERMTTDESGGGV